MLNLTKIEKDFTSRAVMDARPGIIELKLALIFAETITASEISAIRSYGDVRGYLTANGALEAPNAMMEKLPMNANLFANCLFTLCERRICMIDPIIEQSEFKVIGKKTACELRFESVWDLLNIPEDLRDAARQELRWFNPLSYWEE